MGDKHILIVDSYRYGRELVKYLLEQNGFNGRNIYPLGNYRLSELLLENLEEDGLRGLMITEVELWTGNEYQSCFGLAKKAIELKQDVIVYSKKFREHLSQEFADLIVNFGINFVLKSAEYSGCPKKFYQKLLEPILGARADGLEQKV